MEQSNLDLLNRVQRVVDLLGFTIHAAQEIKKEMNYENISQAYKAMIKQCEAPGPGVFICLRRDGAVEDSIDFGGARGAGLFPPKKGSSQSDMSIFQKMSNDRNMLDIYEDRETRISYQPGFYSRELYAQGAMLDNGTYLVLAFIHSAPWAKGAEIRGKEKRHSFYPNSFLCRKCGKTYACGIGVYCNKCNHLRCPEGHCHCPPFTERVCERCFELKRIPDGSSICDECREEEEGQG